MQIEFTYPNWYVIISLLIGFLYAFFLYRKEHLLNEVKNVVVYTMAFFRFTTVTLLCLLLMKPLLKVEHEVVEKPILIATFDNSESILLNKDSAYYSKDYLNEVVRLKEKISSHYELKSFTFGNTVTQDGVLDFSGKQTDISSMVEEVYARYYGRNIGAVIISSDGIINKGLNPLYVSKKIKYTPFFTIALGDTSIRKDLILKEVNHNKIAYKGNQFPVEMVIKGNKIPSGKVQLSIEKSGAVVFSKELTWNDQSNVLNVEALLEAKSTGKQKYSVHLEQLEGEVTYENNSSFFYVDVLDSKQKVLVLARAPHPDIAAITQSWEKNENYEVEVKLAKDFKGNVKPYSMVVMHDLPSDKQFDQAVQKVIEANVPAFFILGSRTNISELNNYNLGVSIKNPSGFTDVSPSVNTTFNLFAVTDGMKKLVGNLPPLKIPFAAKYQTSESTDVFLFQKVGSTLTDYPLMCFNEKNNTKYGFLLGEGIWRWKLEDYSRNKSHENFNGIISKMTQFMSLKDDKSRFRVNCNTNQLENEPVIFTAELYNDSYELVNDPEVILELTNEEGEQYPDKLFSQSGNAYRLDAGSMSPGEYKYRAHVTYGGKKYEADGGFRVKELKTEYLDVVANHHLLNNIAVSSGGEMFYPNQMDELVQAILNKEDIVNVSHTEQSVKDLIDWKWIFIVLMSLLTVEWFLRKRNGAY